MGKQEGKLKVTGATLLFHGHREPLGPDGPYGSLEISGNLSGMYVMGSQGDIKNQPNVNIGELTLG